MKSAILSARRSEERRENETRMKETRKLNEESWGRKRRILVGNESEERKYKKRHARRKEKLHGTCLDGRGSEGTMNNRVGLSELCDAARPGGVKLLAVLPVYVGRPRFFLSNFPVNNFQKASNAPPPAVLITVKFTIWTPPGWIMRDCNCSLDKFRV